MRAVDLVRNRKQLAGRGVVVRIVTKDRDGRRLHEGQLAGSFRDRGAAIAAIKLHLQQFDRTGYDQDGDVWWGRPLCEPCQQTIFHIG